MRRSGYVSVVALRDDTIQSIRLTSMFFRQRQKQIETERTTWLRMRGAFVLVHCCLSAWSFEEVWRSRRA